MKLLISNLLVLALLGCTTAPKPVIEVSTISEKPAPNIPIPVVTPTDLKDVNWQVKDNSGEYTYSLNQAGFDAMLLNIQELRRYLLDQKSVINYLIPFINKNAEPLPNSEPK